jgi:hypothetical protein
MDNTETLATLDTQDTGQRQTKQGAIKNVQSRDTGNIRYTRHRTKTNKTRGHQEWTIKRHWQLVLFVFVLCLVYLMLPVFLGCPFLMAPCFVCLCPVSCVSNVSSVSGLYILDGPLFYLSLSCVLCI